MSTPYTTHTDYNVVPSNPVPFSRKFSWSGIFSGTFLFLAIEVTFGLLGLAVFGKLATPAAPPVTIVNLGLGPDIWIVVLSIIALYFAGRLSSTQSSAPSRNSGMYSGLVTFGMCVFTVFLIVGASPWLVARGAAVAAENFTIGNAYALFVTFILGMIAAAAGGMQGSMATATMRPTLEHTVEPKRVA